MINRAILYNKFIRYDELVKIVNECPSFKDSTTGHDLNIFIDLQSIYKDILSTDIIGSDTKTLSINVLNMVAHYRHFFRNLLRTNVCVFIVNSVQMTNNIGQIQNNNNAFKLIESLCKYLPDIYYIYREGVNASFVIPGITMSSVYKPNPSLIISNDIYSYQFPAMWNNCFVLRIGIKHRYLITRYNAIDLQFKNSTQTSDLTSNVIPLIMAFNKCKELDIPLLFTYKKAIDYIRSLIGSGYLTQGYTIPYPGLDKVISLEGFYHRWTRCDLKSNALMYSESPAILDTTWEIKKQCNLNQLANIIDSKLNYDPENILNYVYLLE